MSTLDGTSIVPPTSLQPVSVQERLLTLDVLRGIALLGVVIANVWLWFSGLQFRFPGYLDELRHLSADSVVFVAISLLVSGKAISTFSFLFGLGFAVQMLRAQARGRSIVPLYARRLTVLFAIGAVHLTLLWYGDILTVYALLGFTLLLFRQRSDRTLLTWATILICGVPLLLGAVPFILSAAGVAIPQPDPAEAAQRNLATLTTFQSGSYAMVVRENLRQASQFYLSRKTPFLLYVAGVFLVGLYVGRRRIFENIAAHRASFRRIAVWGIAIGLVGGIAIELLKLRVPPPVMRAHPSLMLLAMVLFIVNTVPLAAGYISAATLLLQHPAFARRLYVFAPVGRMALTNYLTQTIVMLLIFYGYGGGLVGRTGPAAGLAIAVGFYAVQMIWSPIWLRHFQFGPMEWVWRSLTYGARQPMKISPNVDGGAARGATVERV